MFLNSRLGSALAACGVGRFPCQTSRPSYIIPACPAVLATELPPRRGNFFFRSWLALSARLVGGLPIGRQGQRSPRRLKAGSKLSFTLDRADPCLEEGCHGCGGIAAPRLPDSRSLVRGQPMHKNVPSQPVYY